MLRISQSGPSYDNYKMARKGAFPTALTAEQRKYCVTRRELLAVVRFTRQFRHYLLGRHFEIRTDHSNLQWLMNIKNPNGQLARWLEELSQYWMDIRHRPGGKHVNADALSRLEDDSDCDEYKHNVQPEDLPCDGRAYCVNGILTEARTNST